MDLTMLDEQLNLMVARLELEGETCGLKHSKVDPAENHTAVNYLCQGLGNPKKGETHQELRVPICQECSEALFDENWILVYCTYCSKSQWIYRPLAKRDYQKGNLIFWLDVCPHCAEIVNEKEEDK